MLTDHLVLRTVDGAADLLAADLRAIPSVHSVRQTSADAVACTLAGGFEELAGCTLWSTVEIRDLEHSSRCGLLSTLEPPLRFRVGERDPARRQELITATEQRFGWVNRPADWDVNLEHSAGGWVVQFGPLSLGRRFGRPERLPWSTNLIAAEVLVRLAKLRPGHRVLDPFCGTGTILRAVLRHQPAARPIGTDHDVAALELAIRNAPAIQVMPAAAEALPFTSSSVDRVVANLPFGKQVGSHRGNRGLYPAVLAELNRVLTTDGRAILLTEDKRLLEATVERQRGLKIVRRRLLRYNGATPTVHVLTRTR